MARRDFMEMLTYDKPSTVFVLRVTPHTHTRYKWNALSLPMLAVFYFIFSKRSSFQSGNRRVVVHSNTTPRLPEQSVVRTVCVCVDTAVSVLKWSQWGARCRRRQGERRDTGCLVNLWRIWNCQVIAMPCHRFERMQKQLLTGDWQTERQVEVNSLQQNMCRLFRRHAVQCPVFDVIQSGSLVDRGCGCMPTFYFLRLNFASAYFLMFYRLKRAVNVFIWCILGRKWILMKQFISSVSTRPFINFRIGEIKINPGRIRHFHVLMWPFMLAKPVVWESGAFFWLGQDKTSSLIKVALFLSNYQTQLPITPINQKEMFTW